MPRPEAYALRRQILIWVQHSQHVAADHGRADHPASTCPAQLLLAAGLSGLSSSRFQPVNVSHDLVIFCYPPSKPPHLGRASDADHSGRKEWAGSRSRQRFQGHAATFDHFRWPPARGGTGRDRTSPCMQWAGLGLGLDLGGVKGGCGRLRGRRDRTTHDLPSSQAQAPLGLVPGQRGILGSGWQGLRCVLALVHTAAVAPIALEAPEGFAVACSVRSIQHSGRWEVRKISFPHAPSLT